MTRPSASPYTRHGAQLDTEEPRNTVYALTQGLRESPFMISHLVTGEWRNWRTIIEETGIENPFDLGDFDGSADPSRTEVLVPKQQLGTGRGE